MTYLTDREAELTRLVAGEQSNDELCAHLRLSCAELEQELTALAQKLRRGFGGAYPA